MRFLPLALLALTLAACGSDPQPSYRPVATAAAEIRPERPGILFVTLLDLPPGGQVREIVLIGPEGGETRAGDLEERVSESGPGYGPTGVGLVVSGGSSSGVSTGVSVGVNSGGGGRVESRRSVTGRIPIPDPAAYAADPGAWTIEARWTDVTGETRVIRPAPPLP